MENNSSAKGQPQSASNDGMDGQMPHHVYNLIILDESGSMQSIKTPTITGFNEVVQTIKDVEEKFSDQKHFVSLIVFNSGGIRTLHWNNAVAELQPLDDIQYQPNHGTPLFDAMGAGITRLKESLPTEATYNVLVTVLTDGMENASVSYSGEMIRRMVEELNEASWTFAYIGANHDVDRFASRLSIKNTMRYEANEANMKLMWDKEKMARMKMAEYVAFKKKGDPIQFNEGLYDEEK